MVVGSVFQPAGEVWRHLVDTVLAEYVLNSLALMLGVAESFVQTFYGPSWAPLVAFGVLLLTLAFRPQGLYGRL